MSLVFQIGHDEEEPQLYLLEKELPDRDFSDDVAIIMDDLSQEERFEDEEVISQLRMKGYIISDLESVRFEWDRKYFEE